MVVLERWNQPVLGDGFFALDLQTNRLRCFDAQVHTVNYKNLSHCNHGSFVKMTMEDQGSQRMTILDQWDWPHLGAQQHIHSLYLQPCRMFMNFQPRNCPSSFANMTAICDSIKAFPFFLEDVWFMGSDVKVTPSVTQWIELLFLHCLVRVYLNFTPTSLSPWWHARAPAFSFIATKDGCIRRSSARTFRKNFRQIWKAPDMLQAQSGKIWKTLENIYSNYPKDILSSK